MPHRHHTRSLGQTSTQANGLFVDRAAHEIRRGRPVVVFHKNIADIMLVQCAENMTKDTFAKFKALTNTTPAVVMTRTRAQSLNVMTDDETCIGFRLEGEAMNCDKIQGLANPLHGADVEQYRSLASALKPMPIQAQGLEAAAIGLMKIARLLPTALVSGVTLDDEQNVQTWASQHNLMTVEANDIFLWERSVSQSLCRVSEAPVPLKDAEQAKVIAYRPRDGGQEHLALIIGNPEQSGNVPLVRLHSQCFTGDLLGSLRCDCGDQLRGAIRAIAADGSGILLYLAQEGRGIGLVNKLRAYVLQDQGEDTLEANKHLGFDEDERVYLPAARMLDDLGISKIRLMTNNPQKVEALIAAKIQVVERVSHAFPSNQHNAQYLKTKKEKAGHFL